MKIKFRKMKADDEQLGLKAGDIVVVDYDYDYDFEKVICVGKLVVDNNHSLYKHQIEKIEEQELSFKNTPVAKSFPLPPEAG